MRNQLHRYKKAFTGREFVTTVLEVGRVFAVGSEPSSASSTPVQLTGTAGITPGGLPMEYTAEYAIELAHFLLGASILIELPGNSVGASLLRSGASYTPPQSTDDDESQGGANSEISTHSMSSQRQRRLEVSSNRSQQTTSTTNRAFSNDKYTFYKFAESEDAESSSLHKSHILSASTVGGQANRGGGLPLDLSLHTSTASSLQDQHREFTKARQGTLFLVYDLLLQRRKKERRVKQFLLTPRALEVVEQRGRRSMDCDLIFKM